MQSLYVKTGDTESIHLTMTTKLGHDVTHHHTLCSSYCCSSYVGASS
jgi:hypothetical protein